MRLWADGAFDLIVSPGLFAELEDVLTRPHIAARVPSADAEEFLRLARASATSIDDPSPLHGSTPDPKDDYLVALARAAGAAVIVSGDRHLTGIVMAAPPVLTPRAFVDLLEP